MRDLIFQEMEKIEAGVFFGWGDYSAPFNPRYEFHQYQDGIGVPGSAFEVCTVTCSYFVFGIETGSTKHFEANCNLDIPWQD